MSLFMLSEVVDALNKQKASRQLSLHCSLIISVLISFLFWFFEFQDSFLNFIL